MQEVYDEYENLPKAQTPVDISVYSFRDLTGQYKPSQDSSLSTAVSQGTQLLLVRALKASKWFRVYERENLQNLLTERKLIANRGGSGDLKNLTTSRYLIEGGILAYESNVRTGGTGANYLGIGAWDNYREDMVVVSLRLVDTVTGEVLTDVISENRVFSRELHLGVFQFISEPKLLEFESGLTYNEPRILCVKRAIEKAVVRLILEGIDQDVWLNNLLASQRNQKVFLQMKEKYNL